MSFNDAVAALGDAIDTDSGNAPSPVTPASTEQAPTTPTTPEGEIQSTEPVQPSGLSRDEFGRFMTKTEQAQNEPAADTFDGGAFNPDTLPPELQPGWKQLQAAFTQKTQALAEHQRTLEEQAQQFDGIDPAAAREALDLYRQLQDPSYLVQFHSELSTALQAEGLTQAQADAVAAQQVAEHGGHAPGSVNDTLAALRNDPELAPVADELTQLRQMVEQMNADRVAEREQQLEVQRQMAIAGEQIRQEAVLVEQGFNDPQLTRVHRLSNAFGGNLLSAADELRSIRQEAVEDFLAAKAAVEPGVASLPTSHGTSVVPTEIQDIDTAQKAALAHLAQAGIEHLDL